MPIPPSTPLPEPATPSPAAPIPATPLGVPIGPAERVTDRKQQILQQAALLFSAEGYQATSMRHLAVAVGIEAASLYSHFPSKEAMLQAIAWQCADDFFASVEPISRSGLTVKAKLKAMIVAHIEVLVRNQAAAVVFIDEWRHLNAQLRDEYASLRDRYERLFREVIHAGIVENLFRNAEPRYVALFLLSALNGTARWYRPDGPMTATEAGELQAALLLEGLIRTV